MVTLLITILNDTDTLRRGSLSNGVQRGPHRAGQGDHRVHPGGRDHLQDPDGGE